MLAVYKFGDTCDSYFMHLKVQMELTNELINFRLDKTRFHIIGAILFTAQSALLHPTAVVKTRMQVDGSGLSHLRGVTVFKQILKNDGIPGIFRGFGTSAVGSLPGRVLALTSLEVSKDMMLKYTEHLNMSEATRVGIANGVAGMLSNLVSCAYFVPLEVVGKFFISNILISYYLMLILSLLCMVVFTSPSSPTGLQSILTIMIIEWCNNEIK